MVRGAILFLMLGSAAAQAFASGPAWVEVRSPHFTVVTDAGEKQGRQLADQFERMRWVFQTLFPKANADPIAPIVTIAVRNKQGLEALEPEAYRAKGQVKLAGLFLRGTDKNYILLRLDAEEAHAYANVYHEYTHYLMRKADGWLPLWLNEGLAQFYENTDIDDKTVWLGQANPDELRFLGQRSAADCGAA